MTGPDVSLRRGRLAVTVRGGDLLGVTSWTVDGHELLADPAALPAAYRVHGRRAGITLLHPWANRLRADAFTVAGRSLRVPQDDTVSRDADGLAIHGLAAPAAWEPQARGRDRCVVHREVAACDAFPFAHEVEVEVALPPAGGLRVTTAVTASADGPLPVAFGWHPYFVVPGERATWRLGLPGAPCPEPLGDRTFDDGHVDVARSTWSIGPVELTQDDGYPAAQVFAPGDRDVVSLEPMTAPTDALRTGEGLPVLAPGGRHVASFTLVHRG